MKRNDNEKRKMIEEKKEAEEKRIQKIKLKYSGTSYNLILHLIFDLITGVYLIGIVLSTIKLDENGSN